MSAGAWAMAFVMIIAFGSLLFIIGSMMKHIQNERSAGKSVWKEFGLGLTLMILFLATWLAHGFTEWQTYTDEQRTHDEPVEVGDFMGQFWQSTLENWQSEFLQLFAFVTLAGMYIHKGSAESKDSDEKVEASLRRIEEKLDTLPSNAPKRKSEAWKLPDAPPT